MIDSSPRRCRSRLLATCAFALVAVPGFAQSYPDRALQGGSTVVSGTVTIGRTPLKDTITVASAQAVINWNPETGPLPLPPSPTPINFLPNGREAVFQGATLGQDFVVLNRILPSTNRPISINGTVTSQIVTGFGGGPPPVATYGRGGSVWFYSPGGIIAGPTSVFNVGNLILTANDIDAVGGLFSGAGAIRFRAGAGSTSAVTVQPGAQINLTNASSYLAIVAPQVSMGGTATVNGSAAYVAAEQVDMTINGGFFSIAFLVGTDVANALTHSGTTTGPAGNGTIAMAAMPKNTAITMLVGGTVGYTPAATAALQNGTVVLSAGQGLVFGTIAQNPSITAANLNIGSGLFRSQVNAQATNIVAAPTGGVPLNFTSHANLTGLTSAQLRVDAGQSVTVGGNLNLVSARVGIGGTASVTVNDGTLAVTGQTLINTNAVGLDNPPGTGGNAVGGQSLLTVNGGTVTLGDTLFLTANGTGGGGALLSGNGTGGTAAITLNAGATPTVLALNGINNQISATGSAGNGQLPSLNGGNATGGAALLTINSGLLNSTELFLNAFAEGGEAGANGLAGNASGGTARVLMTGGRYNTNSLFLNAEERQGTSGTGGTAGGTTGTALAAVDVSGTGILAIGAAGGNAMSINANAVKATARVGAPVAGGNLIAGTARLSATNGGTITTDATVPKPANLVTASVVFADSIPGAPSASQRGGTAVVNADGGTMTLHRLDIRATALDRATNLATDPAGPSFGGTATLAARNGGNITVLTGSGATPISVWATGGNATTPLAGTGGTITVLAEGGTLNLVDGLSADATGRAGTNQPGTGGAISLLTRAGTGPAAGIMTVGATTLDASGNAPGFASGPAGTITLSNTGAGQTMTLASVTAHAGAPGGATSGGIAITGDAASLNVTGAATLRTSGTLGISGVGTNGRFSIGGALTGTANTIILTHSGVAAAANVTTVAGPAISLTATNDLLFTGPATVSSAAPTLVAGRDLGGVDGAVVSTGDIILGTGRDLTFRLLTATGRLLGFNGAGPPTPFVTIPGFARVSDRVQTGAGNIDLRAGTGIALGAAITGAGGGINLTTTAGNVLFGTINAATTLNVAAPGTITGTSATATTGPLTLSGANGITVPTLVSGGATTLAAANGAITVATNIQSAGTITATGQSIFLRALGSLTTNTLVATAGLVDVASVGLLTATTTQATNSVTLASTGGNVVFGTATAGTALAVTAPGTVTGTTGTATGPVTINGSGGITVPTIISGGTTTLTAANGAISVATNLQSAGLVNASGRSVFLRATGALTTGTLTATAGAIDVQSSGPLGVTTAQASTSVNFASTGGNVALGSTTAGTALTVTSPGNVSGTSAIATTGALSITGTTGIDVATVTGNAVTLSAPNGPVRVTNDLRTGNPTITGQSLFLRSVGQMGIGTLTATGTGGIDAAAGGSMQLLSVQSPNGPVTLSASTLLNIQALTSGSTTTLTSPNGATSVNNLQSAGVLSAAGQSIFVNAIGPITASTLNATAGAATVQVTNGSLTTGTTTATGAVTLSSSTSTLAFGTVQSGGNALLTAGTTVTGTSVVSGGFASIRGAGALSVQNVQAAGFVQLASSMTAATITVGTAVAGTFLEARGATLNFGNVTAGTDVILSSYNGGLTVGDVTAGDDIFLTVNGSFANPGTVSPDSQTGVVSNTINALVAGNLRSTGLGSDVATSGPLTFGGAGPTGNVIRVRASGAVQTGSITTGGTAIVASDLSTIATQAITGTAGVGIYVRGNATTGNITTNGLFWLGDSTQFFGVVPNYQVTNFAPFQTPTSGSATLGAVSAGLIRGSVLTSTNFASLASTGDTLWTTGLGAVVGGSITGGSISAGGSLTLNAGGSIAFTTATTGTSALLIAGTGNVTGASMTTGGAIAISGLTGIDVPTLISGGTTSLTAANGIVRIASDLRSTGLVSALGQSIFLRSQGALSAASLVATAGNIDVTASNNLTADTIQATGSVALVSNNGDVVASMIGSGPSALVPTSTTLTARNNVTVGSAIVTGAMSIQGGALATLTGQLRGSTIIVRSADIAIGATAQIGTLGTTTSVSFNNIANTQTFVGGSGTGTGAYRLSDAELQRVFANNISIVAAPLSQSGVGQGSLSLTPTVAPDLIVDTLTLAGGTNLGANGTLLIQTRGKMRVIGTVTLNGMTVSNRLELLAVTAIEALPTSSIVMRGAAGLAGTLAMSAEDIIASSSGALADVAAAATLGTASDRLGANDGAAVDGGYFQAGGIVATVSRGIYVQNSGTAATNANRDYAGRRGFTVGSGGFTVVQATAAPVRIAINGRQIGDTTPFGVPTGGGFVTGLDLTPLIRFVPFTINAQPTLFTVGTTPLSATQQQQAAAIFDPASTVNGCAIISAGTCRTTLNDPIRDILQGNFGEGSVGNLLPLTLVQLKEYVTPGDQPLIDEPVTGSGNDDLWSVDDTKPKCDPAKEVCK